MQSNVSSNKTLENQSNNSKFSNPLIYFAVHLKHLREVKYQAYTGIICFFILTLLLFGFLIMMAVTSSDSSSSNSDGAWLYMSIALAVGIYIVHGIATTVFIKKGFLWECDNLEVNKHHEWMIMVSFLIPITGIVAYFFIVIKFWKLKKEYLANKDEIEAIVSVRREKINSK
ncbi:hypothetical protein D8X55_03395 [Malacoplasma penetrans]|uniref:Uncharacterized protein n=1 Tax=Malacoplasma penetrans (strain HF-2) TaxID=272633 RepID=Q8EV38_MALP2|nr:hypothetical protein [Malacoplasma penetrans]RXY96577.1 hypothetical protein D8X55_03395 [Malacoplasma penetrans]BAC44523.1 hypothetical protein [Malacoplasma penetrans HF-2]